MVLRCWAPLGQTVRPEAARLPVPVAVAAAVALPEWPQAARMACAPVDELGHVAPGRAGGPPRPGGLGAHWGASAVRRLAATVPRLRLTRTALGLAAALAFQEAARATERGWGLGGMPMNPLSTRRVLPLTDSEAGTNSEPEAGTVWQRQTH
jgi:hypothetical protein